MLSDKCYLSIIYAVMNDFKNKIVKLFTIPLWLIAILCIVSFGSLIFIFAYHLEEQFYAYIDYVLSAYTLTALCFYCVNTLPDFIRKMKQKAQSNERINKYMNDESQKRKTSVYISFAINIAYVVVNTFSGFYYKTAWFLIFAVYYAIMAVMRFIISRFMYIYSQCENVFAQLKIAKACSVIMLTLNLTLTAAVLMMMYQGRGFDQHGILIYVIALYTFYSTITAVIDVIKYRNLKMPIVSASTMIKLAEALVSMLLLETSMLAQFGAENSIEFKRLMISLTGGGISIVITFMAIYMFIQSSKNLKNLNNKD